MGLKVLLFTVFVMPILLFGITTNKLYSYEFKTLSALEMKAVAGGDSTDLFDYECITLQFPSEECRPEGGCWGLYFTTCNYKPNSNYWCVIDPGMQQLCDGPYPQCYSMFFQNGPCHTYVK